YSLERDSLPAHQPVITQLPPVSDDRILGEQRNDFRDAELCRLLNHPIELVAFDQGLRQGQLERRLDTVSKTVNYGQGCGTMGRVGNAALIFSSSLVKDKDCRALCQPQDS